MEERAMAPWDIRRTDNLWNLLTNPKNEVVYLNKGKRRYILTGNDGSCKIFYSKNEIRKFLNKRVSFNFVFKYKFFSLDDVMYTLQIEEM